MLESSATFQFVQFFLLYKMGWLSPNSEIFFLELKNGGFSVRALFRLFPRDLELKTDAFGRDFLELSESLLKSFADVCCRKKNEN